MRKMPQTRFAQAVCHFSHNADFDQLRISKYPANAHEINYFSMLVVGDFKHTGRDLFDLVLLFMRYYPAGCFWGMNMPKSRYIQAYIPLTWVIWNFGYITVNGANGNDSVKKMKHSILSHIDTLPR